MHSKSDNIEVMAHDNPDEIIEDLFDLLLCRYQINLETQMRGSDFTFDCVNLLYHKCQKINFKHCGSYTDSPVWIKTTTTINPKNHHDRCFQYAATVALNFDEIKKGPERVSNIKPFINNCN